jgi:hypothetical protein
VKIDGSVALVTGATANGGGAIVNMLSITSFYTNPLNALMSCRTYSQRRWPLAARQRLSR